MKINKIHTVIIVTLLAVVSLQAANSKEEKSNEMVRKTVERLTQTYELEPAQVIPLTIIVKRRMSKALSSVEMQDMKLMIAELKKASDDFRSSMDSILTADQKTKLAVKKETVRLEIDKKNKDIKRSQNKKIVIQ